MLQTFIYDSNYSSYSRLEDVTRFLIFAHWLYQLEQFTWWMVKL